MYQSLPTETPRVLIVDDNPAIHEDFRKILLPAEVDPELSNLEESLFGEENLESPLIPIELVSAFQGKDAVQRVAKSLADQQPFAMAFVDMRMPPGWDGVETIEHLWDQDENLEIVVCTAYSDYSWPEMIRRLGRSDKLLILKKPFDTAEVCQMAAALTKKWTLARDARRKDLELNRRIKKDLEKQHQSLEQQTQIETQLNTRRQIDNIEKTALRVGSEIALLAQRIGENICFVRESLTIDASSTSKPPQSRELADGINGKAACSPGETVTSPNGEQQSDASDQLLSVLDESMEYVSRIFQTIETLNDLKQSSKTNDAPAPGSAAGIPQSHSSAIAK